MPDTTHPDGFPACAINASECPCCWTDGDDTAVLCNREEYTGKSLPPMRCPHYHEVEEQTRPARTKAADDVIAAYNAKDASQGKAWQEQAAKAKSKLG